MYCSKCGEQNSEGDLFCRKCGSSLSQTTPTPVPSVSASATPVQIPPTQPVRRTSGLAIASLVLGIIGFSLLALIFGAIALNQMGKDANLSGKGMAIAGLVLGILGLVATIVIVVVVIIGTAML
jgi:uncharacterized membrane protein YvbJ